MDTSRSRSVRPLLQAVVALVLVTCAACGGQPVDLAKSLQLTAVETGWFDAGLVDGKNKLVPTISFHVKNISAAPIRYVQSNAVFRRVSESDEWSTDFRQVIGAEGLRPGASTSAVVLRSQLGYTGTEPRAEMLQNRLFVDVQVTVFVKQGASQWTKLGEYPIRRIVLTH